MNKTILTDTARSMLANHKGIIAMDESNPTCNKRFAALNIEQTPEMRQKYREMIVTTPGFNEGINAAILYDETVRQQLSDGSTFIDALQKQGMIPGIKVDKGAKEMPGFAGEKVTAGLDGLRERLSEYASMGLRFAKWRSVIAIGDGIPSWRCIENNANVLARYAALCQEAGIVPIVEPEVLMDGNHDLQRCSEVTGKVLHEVFNQLYRQRVVVEGIILKPNMVLPGNDCREEYQTDEIAEATVTCLMRSVPAAVAGIAFLSGGQSSEDASQRLNAMNKRYASEMPWPLAFSFSRALQFPAMEIWGGREQNKQRAQQALYHRIRCNQSACAGKYNADMEEPDYFQN